MIARFCLIALMAACFVPATVLGNSTESEVRSKSMFKDFSLSQVEDGQILDNRVVPADFPQVEAVQTCFIIKAPVSRVSTLLLSWNPAGKSGLDVSSHQSLSSADASSFHDSLVKYFKTPGGSWLVDQSKKATAPSCELLLNAKEKSQLAAAHEGNIANIWASILADRFAAFRDHGAAGFSTLLNAMRKSASLEVSPPSGEKNYWELSDVDHRGSISEGTSWEDGSRVFDGEFFVTSEYIASFNASTLWPVTVKGKEVTLVWRIDSALSDQFSDLHGAERLASTGMILSSTKRTIQAFRQQLEK